MAKNSVPFLPEDKEAILRALKGVDLTRGSKTKHRRKCTKCGSPNYLERHHITYTPPLLVFLCRKCHAMITSVNTIGSFVAFGHKEKRPVYTNKLRVVLWRWFLTPTFPATSKRISKDDVIKALRSSKFKIEPRDHNPSTVSLPNEQLGQAQHPSAQPNVRGCAG